LDTDHRAQRNTAALFVGIGMLALHFSTKSLQVIENCDVDTFGTEIKGIPTERSAQDIDTCVMDQRESYPQETVTFGKFR
jgi:hypothetical protein